MFLKNKNIIFKIRRSKVTDYAALSYSRITLKSTSSVFMFVFWMVGSGSIKTPNTYIYRPFKSLLVSQAKY